MFICGETRLSYSTISSGLIVNNHPKNRKTVG